MSIFRRNPPKDHTHKHLKLLLRQALLPRIRPQVALDLFAGKGEIAESCYLGFEELYCVEKHPRSFALLEKRFREYLPGPDGAAVKKPVVRLFREDNLRFIAEELPAITRINGVDFDAYASPQFQIKAFFNAYPVREPMVVFVTDAGRLGRLRSGVWHPDWFSAREPSGPPAERRHPAPARHYELLIRQFWAELERAHGFNIKLFRLYWRQQRTVAYSGIFLVPA